MENADTWRVPAPEAKAGRYSSIIQDTKELVRAVKTSTGNYLFTENDTKGQPLAIIGTLLQIASLLHDESHVQVENRISAHAKIYAGIDEHHVRQRFVGAFPLTSAVDALVKGLSRLVPPAWLMDVASAATDACSIISSLRSQPQILEAASSADRSLSTQYILRISYLPEEGLTMVGQRSISFGQLLDCFGRLAH